jgi:hypothetical protein
MMQFICQWLNAQKWREVGGSWATTRKVFPLCESSPVFSAVSLLGERAHVVEAT